MNCDQMLPRKRPSGDLSTVIVCRLTSVRLDNPPRPHKPAWVCSPWNQASRFLLRRAGLASRRPQPISAAPPVPLVTTPPQDIRGQVGHGGVVDGDVGLGLGAEHVVPFGSVTRTTPNGCEWTPPAAKVEYAFTIPSGVTPVSRPPSVGRRDRLLLKLVPRCGDDLVRP